VTRAGPSTLVSFPYRDLTSKSFCGGRVERRLPMTATFARDRAYLANARAFGRRWRDYVGLAAATAAIIAGLLVVPAVPLRPVLIGFVLGAITMAVVLSASV